MEHEQQRSQRREKGIEKFLTGTAEEHRCTTCGVHELFGRLAVHGCLNWKGSRCTYPDAKEGETTSGEHSESSSSGEKQGRKSGGRREAIAKPHDSNSGISDTLCGDTYILAGLERRKRAPKDQAAGKEIAETEAAVNGIANAWLEQPSRNQQKGPDFTGKKRERC